MWFQGEQERGGDAPAPGDGGPGAPGRPIDVSDSSSEEDDARAEPEDAQVMTVGDCQIVKLPANNDDNGDKPDQSPEANAVTSSTNSAVTITPITTVGDCTIRPVENA